MSTFINNQSDLSTRIDMAIAYLKQHKIIRYQKEIAERMGVDVNTVSRAKHGGDYNAENFAMNFNAAFDFKFSASWLLRGEGPMLAASTNSASIINHPDIIQELPHSTNPQINSIPSWADSLISIVTANTKTIEDLHRLNSDLTKEIALLRKELELLSQSINLKKSTTYQTFDEAITTAAEPNVSPITHQQTNNQTNKS